MAEKPLKIAIIGTGYVGLVSGACFAELGNSVICIDKDKGKIKSLEKGVIPIFEPGLDKVVKENVDSGRLKFTDSMKNSVPEADIVIIAVGTPPKKNGDADLTYVFAAAEEVASHAKDGVIIVTKSTVPVGTGAKVKQKVKAANKKLEFHVASNPEFLREGCAVKDFLEPDRVIIGAESKKIFDIIAKAYAPKKLKKPILFTDIQTAELTKYAANAFLATKVAFINEMADLCEASGANIDLVAEGMGMDRRISPFFLKAGPGFGGSCFPKDTLALESIAKQYKAPSLIVESVIKSNILRKVNIAQKIKKAAGGELKGKTIAALGLAFKANTDDMRESASLTIIPALLRMGAVVKAYDPVAMDNAKAMMKGKGLTYAKNMESAVKNADVIVIITEWDEFKQLDVDSLSKQKKVPVIVDLRNILPLHEKIKIIQVGK